jgi:hypothetical protein
MLKLTFKPDADQLVATHGEFRVVMVAVKKEKEVWDRTTAIPILRGEIVDVWHYAITHKGVQLCSGRALDADNQQGVLRTAHKMLAQFLMMEPYLGTCDGCGGATWPFKPAVAKVDCPDCRQRPEDVGQPNLAACATCKQMRVVEVMVTDDDWYAERAAAAKEFFGNDIPDHLVYRCLSQDCELHKKPQRGT